MLHAFAQCSPVIDIRSGVGRRRSVLKTSVIKLKSDREPLVKIMSK